MTEPNPELPPMGQPSGYPASVPAAQPIPALPYSNWMSSHYRPRPGILSAVGVISIVVACISFIASMVGGCQAGTTYMMSKMAASMNQTSSSTTVTTSSTGASSSTITTVNIVGTTASVSPTTVAVADASPTTEPTTQPVAMTPSTALTATEVAGAVTRAQSATGNKLNPAQIKALTAVLQDPNQTLVAAGTAWSPVSGNSSVGPDGSAFIMFTGGFVTLDPYGKLQQNNMQMPKFNISTPACIFAGIVSLASLGLAIFLFIAGIIVIRSSPAGRKLHLIYAALKIPVAIGGAFALGSLYSQFYVSVGAATLQTVGYAYAVAICGLALIYPIALLITMNTQGVREYYRQG